MKRLIAIIVACVGMAVGTAGCTVAVRRAPPRHTVYVDAPPPRRVVVVQQRRPDVHVRVRGRGHRHHHHNHPH
jgi:hypothetical protein